MCKPRDDRLLRQPNVWGSQGGSSTESVCGYTCHPGPAASVMSVPWRNKNIHAKSGLPIRQRMCWEPKRVGTASTDAHLHEGKPRLTRSWTDHNFYSPQKKTINRSQEWKVCSLYSHARVEATDSSQNNIQPPNTSTASPAQQLQIKCTAANNCRRKQNALCHNMQFYAWG